MRCPNCQMEVEPGKPVCGYCGAPMYAGQQNQPYPPPVYGGYYPPPAPYPPPGYGYYPPQSSGTPIAAGVLLLIGGILALIDGVIVLALGSLAGSLVPEAGAIYAVCGALVMVFGILGLLGGIVALQRKLWALALVGAIFCMLSIGPYFISSILGLIALILVAISKNEFQ